MLLLHINCRTCSLDGDKTDKSDATAQTSKAVFNFQTTNTNTYDQGTKIYIIYIIIKLNLLLLNYNNKMCTKNMELNYVIKELQTCAEDTAIFRVSIL